MKNIKLKDEELDVMIMLIRNELTFLEGREYLYDEDTEYIETLKNILDKLEK